MLRERNLDDSDHKRAGSACRCQHGRVSISSDRSLFKRLVVCCDGTWNRPDNVHVTNIEKIARTVETRVERTEGVQQLVLYLSGVGAGSYQVDRLLGGAFGFGLFNNVRSGYRFLALNYEPGDEIYVFGFSRGAYTARSIVGMVSMVGLLTRRSLVRDKLRTAVELYRDKSPAPSTVRDDFKKANCHPEVPVTFLGVFDTVGALGVPGAWRRRHQFHSVNLSRLVQCARQALSIDDRRLQFEPALWLVDADHPEEMPSVRQVWFQGVHADVGGGYGETGLSDTALLWMAREAHQQGLVFDGEFLATYVDSGSPAEPHESLNSFYRVLNVLRQVHDAVIRNGDERKAFLGGRRNLTRAGAVSVRMTQTVVERYRQGEYMPANVAAYAVETDNFAVGVEPVRRLPPTESLRLRAGHVVHVATANSLGPASAVARPSRTSSRAVPMALQAPGLPT